MEEQQAQCFKLHSQPLVHSGVMLPRDWKGMLSNCWNALCHGSHAGYPMPHRPVSTVFPWKCWGPTTDNLQWNLFQTGAQWSGDTNPKWTFVLQGDYSTITLLPPAASAECQHPAAPGQIPSFQRLGTVIIALKSLSRTTKAASSTGETWYYICDK